MDLLFDLDGTLTDSGVGITRCIQHALAEMGRPVPTMADLFRFVGPPLRQALEELLDFPNADQVEEAIRLYRSRFATIGIFENKIYPEVLSVLAELSTAGHSLWVVTSKPIVFAKRILDHFGLTSLFEGVYGSELSGQNSEKADLIRILLEERTLSPLDSWMIGDRAQDILGARTNGVASVAALWGYGTEEELRAAKPDWIAHSIGELRRWAV